MQTIHPCLWFNRPLAEEAARFYVSLFPRSRLNALTRIPPSVARATGHPEGQVLTADLELHGLKVLLLNGAAEFKQNPSGSLFVWCESETQVDRLWKALTPGGEVRMGLDKYPWSSRYGWTTDRFGMEWQLMHAPGHPPGMAPCFLWTDERYGKAKEAMELYGSVFGGFHRNVLAENPEDGTLLHAEFTLGGPGNRLVFTEGKGKHGHRFSNAFSLVVGCDTQAEIDRFFSALSHVPEAEACGWISDRYGVSWQIVPAELGEWMKDPKRMEPLMAEVLQRKKLDLERLRKA
jgi:predicted 3-demethylubiquinone-9 3-methyltransferase (glyoxalase superfamily)